MLTVYVKKEEEKAYHAVMFDTLTAHDFKMEVWAFSLKDFIVFYCKLCFFFFSS